MEQRIGHEPFSDATLVWDGEPMRGPGFPDPDLIPHEEAEPFDPGRISMRFRESNQSLVAMPWDKPLMSWSDANLEFVDLPVGASRHVVRFVVVDGSIYALKELPVDVGEREYAVLRELEARRAPSVRACGLVTRTGDRASIIITRYLARSLQFRRLFRRLPMGAHKYRDQLLDSMTGLLVELHRMGMFWGDCSLANTLLMRDGQRLQAYLVDGETSELHERLSDGQREADIEIAIENVAGDLVDMGVMNGRTMEEMDDDFEAALSIRDRYESLWDVLHQDVTIHPDKRYRVDKQLAKLHELGYVVDEVILEPGPDGTDDMRLRVAVAGRDYHSRRLRQLTGIEAGEGQSAILLNDLTAWAGMGWAGDWDSKEGQSGRQLTRRDGARWTLEIFEPAVGQLVEVMGEDIDHVQAYCDLLEVRWLLSEAAGHDVGNSVAIRSIAQRETPAGSSAEMVVAETPTTPRRLGWNRP
jgi:Domain of unknown function (DUF4032)/Lipopolysaccharide kinase (Kdo/WaaP) family